MAHQSIAHSCALSFGKGVHAIVIGVVHEILHHGFRTAHGRAANGPGRRRGVTNPVTLRQAIAFVCTAVGIVESVQQTQIVPDFMGQSPVQVEVVEQIEFCAHTEHLVVKHDAIMRARSGR